MEGAGAGAGEATAWAIENPTICVHLRENPVLRSIMEGQKKGTKQPPGQSDALAKAGVCDPSFCVALDPVG